MNKSKSIEQVILEICRATDRNAEEKVKDISDYIFITTKETYKNKRTTKTVEAQVKALTSLLTKSRKVDVRPYMQYFVKYDNKVWFTDLGHTLFIFEGNSAVSNNLPADFNFALEHDEEAVKAMFEYLSKPFNAVKSKVKTYDFYTPLRLEELCTAQKLNREEIRQGEYVSKLKKSFEHKELGCKDYVWRELNADTFYSIFKVLGIDECKLFCTSHWEEPLILQGYNDRVGKFCCITTCMKNKDYDTFEQERMKRLNQKDACIKETVKKCAAGRMKFRKRINELPADEDLPF